MVKQITYYKNKSLLDLSPNIVICHQVNCQGVMGAVIAKQIRARWPEVYTDYKKTIERAEAQIAGLENPPDDILLGAVACTTTIDGHRVASLFAQYDYGYGPRRYTNYEAFANCLENLNKRDYIDSHRSFCPLRKAEDSIEINTTNLNIEEVLNMMLLYMKDRGLLNE